MKPTVSEVGYRPPDNPNNFIQIPQTIVRDTMGNEMSIYSTPRYEELGNGNLVVAWSIYRFDIGSCMKLKFIRWSGI